MKKLLTILCLVAVSLTMFSQPIKVRPVDHLLERYNPIKQYSVPVKTIIKYKYKYLDSPVMKTTNPVMKSGRFNIADSIDLKKDDINTKKDTNNIRNFIINNNYNLALLDYNSISNTKSNNELYGMIADLKLLTLSHSYKSKGTIKIVSGLGLQAIAVGMVAYANIDKYSVRNVEETHSFEYTYPVYTVTSSPVQVTTETTVTTNPSNINRSSRMSSIAPIYDDVFCKPKPTHHPKNPRIPPTIIVNNNTTIIVNVPVITTTYETKTVITKDTHQIVEKQERNKTGYYVGASALSLVGVALEVSGIIDFHRANVMITQNSVGISFRF